MAHTSSSPSWLAGGKVGVLGPSFPCAAPVRLGGTEWDEEKDDDDDDDDDDDGDDDVGDEYEDDDDDEDRGDVVMMVLPRSLSPGVVGPGPLPGVVRTLPFSGRGRIPPSWRVPVVGLGPRLRYLVPPPSVPGEDGARSRGWPRSW